MGSISYKAYNIHRNRKKCLESGTYNYGLTVKENTSQAGPWIKGLGLSLNGLCKLYLGGTVGLVPDHGNKTNNTIK